jgi:O-antigen/teichoic acid export membrane protein
MQQQNGTKQKLVRNTIFSYVLNFWNLIIGIVLFPFIVKFVGLELAGIWFLVSEIVGHFGLLELGVTPSVIRHTAFFVARGNKKLVNQNANTSLVFLSFMGIVTGGIIALVGYYFVGYFHISAELIPTAQKVFYAVGLMTVLSFPLSTFGGIVKGLQRYDLSVKIELLSSIVRVTVIFVMFALGFTILALIVGQFAEMLVRWCGFVFSAFKNVPYLKLNLKYVKFKELLRVIKYGIKILYLDSLKEVIFKTDRVVVSLFLPVSYVTFYEAGYKIFATIKRFYNVIFTAMMPAAVELYAQGKNRLIKELYFRATKYASMSFLIMSIPMLFFASYVLDLWVGKDFRQYAYVAQILLVHLFFFANHAAAYLIFKAKDKLKEFLLLESIVMVFNITISIILVRRIGLIGVVLGTTIPFVLLEPFYLKVVFKDLRITIKEQFKNVWLKVYFPAVFSTIAAYALYLFYHPRNLFALALIFAAVAAVYILIAWRFSFTKKEHRDIKDYKDKLFRKLHLAGGQ